MHRCAHYALKRCTSVPEESLTSSAKATYLRIITSSLKGAWVHPQEFRCRSCSGTVSAEGSRHWYTGIDVDSELGRRDELMVL